MEGKTKQAPQVPHLDIPVDDVLAMAVYQRVTELEDVLGTRSLGEPPLFLEQTVDRAGRRVLQDEVDPRVVVEVSEEAKDVAVSETSDC